MANTLAVMNVTQMNTSVQNVVVFNSTHIALGNVAGAATINTQQGTYFSANTFTLHLTFTGRLQSNDWVYFRTYKWCR